MRKLTPAQMKAYWTNETRIRLADEDEIVARARRGVNVGSWIVERKGGPLGGWHEISSHSGERQALQAKARLDRKIAKENKE